jgi:hypothetical protein
VDGTRLHKVGAGRASINSRVLPTFPLSGGGSNLMNVAFYDPGRSNLDVFDEVFILDGTKLLQLTNFGLPDTSRLFLSRGGRRAFFRASADPFGHNPSGNCQLFSIDTLGTDLRQLTAFREGDRSANACPGGGPPRGCSIYKAYQDALTGEVVFYSSCDPLGTNPFGGQLSAMRADGTKIVQLTATRGRTVDDGVVSVELPGPWAYSARPR